MKYQDEVIASLKALASNVIYFAGIGWWYFKYGDYQMVYIPGNHSSNTIRICIPYLDSVENYDSEQLTIAINETNREVKYVKVVILSNRSISINYDHKYDKGNDLYSIVLHILRTLCFTAEYLENKLSKK